jgi:predicted amidohydrolase YtcJ
MTCCSERILVTGGDIMTLDPVQPRPEAMVLDNGHVLALGGRKELEAAWGAGTCRLDLNGRAVVPGFTDSHLHLLSYGLVLDQVQLAGCPSLRRMLELVAEGAAALGPHEWVLGRGWDQDFFVERRYPVRQDLDAVCGGRPALLTRGCGHCSVANTRALELAAIGPGTPDPPGGRIERDPVSGEPTGVLHEKAAGMVRSVIGELSYDTKRRGLERAMRLALSAGIVALHPDDVRTAGDAATARRLYQDLLPEIGGPRVRIDVSEFAMDELIGAGLQSGSGDPMLSIGAIKLFVDGSLGARSAALTRPYADDPGQSGIIVQERETFMRQVAKAHSHGLQVAIHAIGDLAVDWSLDAIEAAQAAGPAWDARHRVVHVQITRPDHPPRFRALGAVAEIQPKFVTTDKLWVDARVGPELARTSYAWKTFIESGVHCAGGSDGPVEPLHPLLGLYAAVTRQGLDGLPAGGWYPEERLSVDQAMRLFTLGGAHAGHSEGWRGSLSPGKAADFVVLDRAPDRVEPAAIKDLAVLATYVGARCVYQA